MVFYALSGVQLHITSAVFLTPMLLAILAGFALGGGIIVCALTTKYRDLSYLVTFGVQLLMYVTPVIFPVSAIPERYQWAVRLNPLTPVFEGFRIALLGAGTLAPGDLARSAAATLVVLTIGLMIFTRVERTFMDTV